MQKHAWLSRAKTLLAIQSTNMLGYPEHLPVAYEKGIWSSTCLTFTSFIPRHGEDMGGGGIEMLGVRQSVTKLVSAITSDFMHRFARYLTQ